MSKSIKASYTTRDDASLTLLGRSLGNSLPPKLFILCLLFIQTNDRPLCRNRNDLINAKFHCLLYNKNGIRPVTLGRRILRTETAGFTVLSWLMYHLE